MNIIKWFVQFKHMLNFKYKSHFIPICIYEHMYSGGQVQSLSRKFIELKQSICILFLMSDCISYLSLAHSREKEWQMEALLVLQAGFFF